MEAEPRVTMRRPEGACWPWYAFIDPQGYGRHGRTSMAHRVVYEALVGPIPEGLQLDHLCRNRSCVNPAHLEPVTMHENIVRGASPFARNYRKVYCKRGHLFTPENTRLNKKGWRTCKTCANESARRSRARKRAVA